MNQLPTGGIGGLSRLSNAKSRSLSAENIHGEKGKGGMAEHGCSEQSARELGKGWKISPCLRLEAGETLTIADIDGPGMIKHIWIVPTTNLSRTLVIRMYWDGSETPSVEAPLGDFFAAADFQEFRQLTSLAVCVNPRDGLNCYWEMPFYKHCRITIENIHVQPVHIYYQIDYMLDELPQGLGYFHAQFRRANPLPYMDVYTILDGVKGKGTYIGTYMLWGVKNNGWWGEGEIKYYLDGDTEYPTICGTGTEDYFCGSYGFEVAGEYVEYNTPYCGMYKVSETDKTYKSQRRFGMYRWHIADPIYFDSDIRVTIQALGWRSDGRFLPLQDDISSVAFWYQDTTNDDFPRLPDYNGLEII